MSITLFPGVTQAQAETMQAQAEAEASKIHVCANCGKRFVWGPDCSWYGDLDEEVCIKACSTACMEILKSQGNS